MRPDRSVPTISVGGFLGAGKTSFVNNLLKDADGRRMVVFVNDFGAINIDYDLIETVESDRVALTNGCVCCTVNDDLVRTMAEFCERDPPDAFVIEASGVANPKALEASLQTLQRAGFAHMQWGIYLIDADQFGGLDYADTEDLIDHAAASDLVVLNKSDLVSTDQLAELNRLLSRSAPRPERHVTSHGRVPFAKAVGARRSNADVMSTLTEDQNAHSQFETFAFERIPPVSNERFVEIGRVLQAMCLRAKGVLHVGTRATATIQLQLVGQRLSTREITGSKLPSARLVVIGWPDKLDLKLLTSLFGTETMVSLEGGETPTI